MWRLQAREEKNYAGKMEGLLVFLTNLQSGTLGIAEKKAP